MSVRRGASSRRLRGWLAAATLALGACAAPPRFSVRLADPAEVIAVRSHDATDAARLAEVVARERAFLLETVPSTVPRPLEVWRLDDVEGRPLLELGADGLTSHRRGVPWFAPFTPDWWHRTRVLLLDRADDRVVTHELAHALLGPDWDPLPSALEEGLCDWLSFLRFPKDDGPVRHLACLRTRQLGAELDVHRFARGGRSQGFGLRWLRERREDGGQRLSLRDVLQLPERTPWPALSDDGVSHAYAAGYLLAARIVERHGLEGLLEACRAARAEGRDLLSPERVLELAGLPGGLLPHQELLELHEHAFLERALFEPQLVGSLLDLYGEHARPDEPIEQFLEDLRGRLRLETRPPIDWRDLPGFPELPRRMAAERERARSVTRSFGR